MGVGVDIHFSGGFHMAFALLLWPLCSWLSLKHFFSIFFGGVNLAVFRVYSCSVLRNPSCWSSQCWRLNLGQLRARQCPNPCTLSGPCSHELCVGRNHACPHMNPLLTLILFSLISLSCPLCLTTLPYFYGLHLLLGGRGAPPQADPCLKDSGNHLGWAFQYDLKPSGPSPQPWSAYFASSYHPLYRLL